MAFWYRNLCRLEIVILLLTNPLFLSSLAVPLSLEVVGSNVTWSPLHRAVTLSCVAMSFPRATLSWSRGPPDSPLHGGRISSETLDHVRVLSTLTLDPLSRRHNGTYYCDARNTLHHRMMAQQDVVVLGELHFLEISTSMGSLHQ